MADVAVAAGISRRHVFQLFSSKSALVWGGSEEFAERHRRAREATDPALPALDALVLAYQAAATFPLETIPVTRRRLEVIAANPSLLEAGAPWDADLAHEMAEFIAARDGDSAHDLRTVVAVQVLAAAVRAALSWWASGSDEPPQDVVHRTLMALSLPYE